MSTKIMIEYNPYYVRTKISINNREQIKGSEYYEMSNGNKRLQDWIDDFFDKIVRNASILIFDVCFIGTALDFEDVEKAALDCQKKYKEKKLVINIDFLEKSSREGKLEAMNELWLKARESPIPGFNSPRVLEAFDRALGNAFEINVVATMSSGKSTLINAFLGTDLLPSANEATTATIARIENDTTKPECVFQGCRFDTDGNRLDEWRDVNEWRKNPVDRILSKWNKDKNTSEIVISGHIPSLSDKDGTNYIFIDTPGPNSNDNKEHKEVTLKAIHGKNPSMILYVFDGTHQCSDDDHSVLELVSDEMKRNGRAAKDRFIFIANKMDALNPRKESIEQALERWKMYLEGDFGIINPVIIPVSAEFAKFLRIIKNYGDSALDGYEKADFRAYCEKFDSIPELNMLQYVQGEINSTCYEKLEEQLNTSTQKDEILLLKTGIPTIEALLNDFMEKHVIPSKLKDGVDCLKDVLKEESIVEKEIELFNSSQTELQEASKRLSEFARAKDEADKGYGIKRQIAECEYKRSVETNQKLQFLFQKKQELQEELESLPETINEEQVREIYPQFCKKGDVLSQQMSRDLDDALEAEYLVRLKNWENDYNTYIQKLIEQTWPQDDLPALKELQKQLLSLQDAEKIINEQSSGTTSVQRKRRRSFGDRVWGIFKLENPFRDYDTWTDTIKTVKKEVFIKEIITELERYLDRTMADFDEKAKLQLAEAKSVVLEKIKQIDAIFIERCKQLEEAAFNEELAKEKLHDAQIRYDWIKRFEPELNSILELEEN